jgi:RNA polymerase sigma-70 factor (ECF subfamily)
VRRLAAATATQWAGDRPRQGCGSSRRDRARTEGATAPKSTTPAPKRRPRAAPANDGPATGEDGTAPARDPGAFAELYEAYADRVYRYLLARTSRPADAEELTSRTFLQALAHLDRYRGRGAGFGAWLMTIAHNLLVNWYRDRGRRPPTAPLDDAMAIPADTPGPESSLLRSERVQRVREAIGTLASERQRLVALKYVHGLSNAEIGRIMGRSEGAVKALHHRTLRQLQKELAGWDEADDATPRSRRAAGTGRGR